MPSPATGGGPKWASVGKRLLPLTCLAAAMGLGPDAGAQTRVYRCTDAAGAIELTQRPCAEGRLEEEIRVEHPSTGWVPPKPAPAADAPRPEKAGTQGKATKEDSAQAARADRCWEKRQRLEEVSWKLRRGYRPQEGVKLRRKRRSYEDYLSRYCRDP